MKLIKTLLKNKKLFLNLRGQSLIEITVALGALAILLTVSATAITSALNNSQEAKFRNQASIYAQQGAEVLRQMRDSSWTSFDSLSGTYCMADTCTQLASSGNCGRKTGACGQNIGNYNREVTILRNDPQCSNAGNNATRVSVIVSWTDSKCTSGTTFCRQVKIETCFSNIYGNTGL